MEMVILHILLFLTVYKVKSYGNGNFTITFLLNKEKNTRKMQTAKSIKIK